MSLCLLAVVVLFVIYSGWLGGVGASVLILGIIFSAVGWVGGFYWEIWSLLCIVYVSGVVVLCIYVGVIDQVSLSTGNIACSFFIAGLFYFLYSLQTVNTCLGSIFSGVGLLWLLIVGWFLYLLLFVISFILGGSWCLVGGFRGEF